MFQYRLCDGFSRLLCWCPEPFLGDSCGTQATRCELCDRTLDCNGTWANSCEKRRIFANRCPKIHSANPSYRTVAILDIKRLRALQDEVPKTRIALVRLVWSDVKAALNRGHSLRAVHQRLADAGLDITYRRLSQCVSRLRREEKRFGLPPKLTGKAPGGPDFTPASTEVGDDRTSRIDAPEERRSAQSATADPLADFRERTARTKTFEFKPGPPDESKLI